MTPDEAKALKPGDEIYHTVAGAAWRGKFVRLAGPYENDRYRIWWKGWDKYNPEKEDWTWDWAIGRLTLAAMIRYDIDDNPPKFALDWITRIMKYDPSATATIGIHGPDFHLKDGSVFTLTKKEAERIS